MSLYTSPLNEVYENKDIYWSKFKLWQESEKLGMNIPQSFLVKDRFVHDFFSKIRLAETWAEELSRLDITEISEKSLEKLSLAVQKKILKSKFDDEFLDEFRKQYASISEFKDATVEIRFLDMSVAKDILMHRNPEIIKGEDKVIDEIKRNLATIFEAKNLYKYYLSKNTPFNFDFTFLVQKFIHFDVYGATMNLTNGNNLETLILARFGDPENLDLRNIGTLVADEYIVKNFDTGEITSTLAAQEKMIVRSAGKMDSVKISKSWMDKPKIGNEKVSSMASFFVELSKEFKTSDLKVYWGLESGKFWLIDIDDSELLDINKPVTVSEKQNFFDPENTTKSQLPTENSNYVSEMNPDLELSDITDLIDATQLNYEINDYSSANIDIPLQREEKNKGIVIINHPEVSNEISEQEEIPTDPKERAKYILFKSPKKSNIDIYSKSKSSTSEDRVQDRDEIPNTKILQPRIPNILDTFDNFKIPGVDPLGISDQIIAAQSVQSYNVFPVLLQAYIFTRYVKSRSQTDIIDDSGSDNLMQTDAYENQSIENVPQSETIVQDTEEKMSDEKTIQQNVAKVKEKEGELNPEKKEIQAVDIPEISIKIISGKPDMELLDGVIISNIADLGSLTSYDKFKLVELLFDKQIESNLKEFKDLKAKSNMKILGLVLKQIKNLKDLNDLKLVLNSLNLKNTLNMKISYAVDNIAFLNNLNDFKDIKIQNLVVDLAELSKLSGMTDMMESKYQDMMDFGIIKILKQVMTYCRENNIELMLDMRGFTLELILSILSETSSDVSSLIVDTSVDKRKLRLEIANLESGQILKSINKKI